MPIGRPRTVTPPDNELVALGDEMIGWVETNTPIHLSQWWRLEKHFTKDVWKNICDHPKFSPYYEEALNIIGLQYLLKNSEIEPSLKHRWQRVYFKDLRDEEDTSADAQAVRVANANKDAAKENNQEVLSRLDKTLAQLSSLQSERNNADNKIKSDAQS